MFSNVKSKKKNSNQANISREPNKTKISIFLGFRLPEERFNIFAYIHSKHYPRNSEMHKCAQYLIFLYIFLIMAPMSKNKGFLNFTFLQIFLKNNFRIRRKLFESKKKKRRFQFCLFDSPKKYFGLLAVEMQKNDPFYQKVQKYTKHPIWNKILLWRAPMSENRHFLKSDFFQICLKNIFNLGANLSRA